MSKTADNFYSTTKAFRDLQKKIREDMVNLKETNTNIAGTAMKLEKKISDLKSNIFNYKEAYLAKDKNVYNSSITDKENIMRINQLESLMTECDKYTNEVDKIKNKRPEDFPENPEVKNFTKEEYLVYQQRKKNTHEELIDNMIGLSLENNKLGKEMNGILSNQTALIEKIGQNLDSTGNRIQKANKRFENFLDSTSYCRLYVIIAVQLAIIIFLIF